MSRLFYLNWSAREDYSHFMLALWVVAKATLSRYARLEPPVGSHPLKMQIIKKPTQ